MMKSKTMSAALSLLTGILFSACREPEQPSQSDPGKKPPSRKAQPARKIAPAQFLEAASGGDLKTVRRALDQGMRPDVSGPDRRTALMLAAYNGHTGVVETLIDAGARVDARDEVDRTALMYASTGDFPGTVELLIKAGSPVNVCDSHEHWTALMFAGAEGQGDVVTILLKNGADPTMRDADGDTAGNFAVNNGHAAVAKRLRAAEKK